MSDTIDPASHGQRPHPGPMTGAFLEFDLARDIRQLHEEDAWNTGHNSRTLAKYDDLRIVLMVLKAGARIHEHKAPGPISIHVVAGRMTVRALGRTFDLAAGRLLILDRETLHDVEALDETAFLLTISWPAPQKQQS